LAVVELVELLQLVMLEQLARTLNLVRLLRVLVADAVADVQLLNPVRLVVQAAEMPIHWEVLPVHQVKAMPVVQELPMAAAAVVELVKLEIQMLVRVLAAMALIHIHHGVQLLDTEKMYLVLIGSLAAAVGTVTMALQGLADLAAEKLVQTQVFHLQLPIQAAAVVLHLVA
jgi:hypothetical protein